MVCLVNGFSVFVIVFVLVYFFVGWFFNGSLGLSVSWSSSYECGFFAVSSSLNSFSFSYFLLLVFFVVFDLEISLLLNMPEQGLLFYNFYYYYFFLFVLSVGFLVEVFMGYVRWGY